MRLSRMPPSTVLQPETPDAALSFTVPVWPKHRLAMFHERIADAELPFHPEVAEKCSLFHKCGHSLQISNSPRLRESVFVAPQDTHFLRP